MTRAAAGYSARSRGRISTPRILSDRMLPPREQGDFGERAALYWLAGRGAHISIPFGSNPHYDLVADVAAHFCRVQVKTSRVCFEGAAGT